MRKEIHKKYQTDSSICEFVDGLPQRFEQEGSLLYDERNVIRRFEVNGTVLVVKRFKRPNFFQRIAYTFFRSSKAFRAYHNGEELIRRGISTPFPIAYLETYSMERTMPLQLLTFSIGWRSLIVLWQRLLRILLPICTSLVFCIMTSTPRTPFFILFLLPLILMRSLSSTSIVWILWRVCHH